MVLNMILILLVVGLAGLSFYLGQTCGDLKQELSEQYEANERLGVTYHKEITNRRKELESAYLSIEMLLEETTKFNDIDDYIRSNSSEKKG